MFCVCIYMCSFLKNIIVPIALFAFFNSDFYILFVLQEKVDDGAEIFEGCDKLYVFISVHTNVFGLGAGLVFLIEDA